jgi:excisionase family DNA binding protein
VSEFATPRERLLAALSPEIVGALLELMDEKVAAAAAVTDGTSPWLSIPEAAAYLRMSERTVERLVARGRVRSTTVGRRRLFHRDDLDALAATGEDVAPTTPSRRR